jgi:hypothetical protein
LGGQQLDRRQDGVQDAVEVGGEDGADRDFGLDGGGDTGIRHHEVERSGGGDPLRHRRGAADVDQARVDCRAARPAGGGDGVQALGVAAGEMEGDARRGAGFRQGAANARGCAGQQDGAELGHVGWRSVGLSVFARRGHVERHWSTSGTGLSRQKCASR